MPSLGLRRAFTAVLVSATIILPSATASAAPNNDSYERVWDIEEYDNCIKFGYGEDVTCCINSGGRWDGPNAGSGKCVAPDPAESQSSAPGKGTRPLKLHRPFLAPKSLLDLRD
jgi:hypothetical protein